MANPYSNLRFASNVDWKNVDRTMLGKLNQLGRGQGLMVDVFSGYRSDAYSQKVGGFAGDPHTRGIAVDANVNGRPIGDTVDAATFARYGLVTGNQPNFFNGMPDPAHVQLGTGGQKPTVAPVTPSEPSQAPAPQDASPAEVAAATAPPPSLPQPVAQQQQPVNLTLQPHEVAATWQQLAVTYPSPDTQRFAQLASLAAGG